MPLIEVFDPAAGCLTGACSPEQRDEIDAFEAELDAAQAAGAEVRRYNLGHEPEAFADNALVKAAIRQQGMAALPIVIVDKNLISHGRYPENLSALLGVTR